MLQSMKDKMAGWITWLIILGISIIFVSFGISSYFEGGGNSQTKTAVKVGKQNISENQVDNALNNYRRTLAEKGQTNLNASVLRKEVIDSLVNDNLQTQGASIMGAIVTDSLTDQAIYQIPAFRQDGKFSMQLYQARMRNVGMTTEMLRQMLKNDLLSSQVKGAISASSFVLPNEGKDFTDMLLQKRDIRYLTLPYRNFIDQIKINNNDLQTFYNTHKSDFVKPAEVSIQYLGVSLPELAKTIKITQQDMQNYYRENKSSFTTVEQRKASLILLSIPANASKEGKLKISKLSEQIEKDLQAGKDFSKLAKQYSNDPISAKKDGDMGWMSLVAEANDFEQTLFNLKKVGDVSTPIQSKYGIQIVKLTGIKPKKIEPFNKVEGKILDVLKKQKGEVLYSSLGNKLANMAYENPQSLEFAAKQLHLQVQTTSMFTRKGADNGIASNKKVIDAAFSTDVLINKNNSDIINLSPTKSIVIRVNKYNPKGTKPFVEVKDIVQKLVTINKEKEFAKNKAKTIASALNSGKTETNINNTYKLNWQDAKNITRNDQTFSPEVISNIFSQLVSSAKEPNYHTAANADKEIIIFAVKQIKLPNGQDQEVGKIYNQMLKNLYGGITYQQYIQYLKNKIPVKIIKDNNAGDN